MKHPAIQKTLKALGTLATLAAVFYLLATLAENASRIRIAFSMALPAAMALFCCMHCLQAVIIRTLLATKISFSAALKVHSVSQVYKYIPGNVGHYFSRWVYLGHRGVRPQENARLILHETFSMVTAFGLLGIVFIATTPWIRDSAQWPAVVTICCAGAAALVLAACAFRKKAGVLFTGGTIAAIVLYVLAAVLSGLILWILSVYTVPDVGAIGFVKYTLGFAVAFLAGFVVPGSPGGIGVREVVFVEIFRRSGTEAYLLTQLIVLFRLIAVATELLFYVLMNMVVRRRP